MNKFPISIIIVNYKSENKVNRLVELLAKDFEIIVIDNSQSKILKEDSRYKLIKNKINYGFAHACNQGLFLAQNPYILFLNSDIEIVKENILSLYRELKNKELFAISPTLFNNNGIFDQNYAKPIINFINVLIEFTPLNKIFKTWTDNRTRTLPGACFLSDKNKLIKIGGWDGRFFVWMEDSDLSRRLFDLDKKFEVSKNIKVKHIGGESFRDEDEDWLNNVFFQSLRNYSNKYFNYFEKKIINKISNRFSKSIFYPSDESVEVSVIVPNLKKDLLVKFLENNWDFFDFNKHELIVVSSVKNLREIQKKYPEIIFIKIKENKGFAKTVNIGFKRARGRWIGTVNDDVILENNWIENLIKNANGKTGSLMPLVLKKNKETESFGVDVLPIGRAVINKNLEKNIIESNSCNAACILFNRKVLEKIGIFDEKFESYIEDLDLGFRISKAGYKNIAIKKVRIIHFGQSSSRDKMIYKKYLDWKNWWLFVFKHTSFVNWVKLGPRILIERGKNFTGLIKEVLK